LLPLSPRELARGHLGMGRNSGQQAGLWQSGGKPPHSKTTRCRSRHQRAVVTITRASFWLAKPSKLRVDRAAPCGKRIISNIPFATGMNCSGFASTFSRTPGAGSWIGRIQRRDQGPKRNGPGTPTKRRAESHSAGVVGEPRWPMRAERRSALPGMTRPDYWLTKLANLRVDRAPATQAMRAAPGVRRVPRPTIRLLLQRGNLQKPGRTRIIYSQAVTANDFICRKTRLVGQIRFTLLGTERRDSKQRGRFSWCCVLRVPWDECANVRYLSGQRKLFECILSLQ